LAKYLAINIGLWGIFLMAQAGSNSYEAMLAFRFVSGMFEAVADPAFGKWYTYQRGMVLTFSGYHWNVVHS
jgi:hypothetical protein